MPFSGLYLGIANVRYVPLNGSPIVRPVMISETDNAATLLKQMGVTPRFGVGTTVVGYDGPKLDRSPQAGPHYTDRVRLVMRRLGNVNVEFQKSDPPAFEIVEVDNAPNST